MRLLSFFLGTVLFSTTAFAADGDWRPLLNGKDMTGWDTFMGKPNRTWDVPGLKRDTNGAYLEPVGKNRDPLKVFTPEMSDGQPAIHISGQGTGVMMTKETFSNYHVRVQMKWGEKKWGGANARRNGGMLYFAHDEMGTLDGIWPRAIEFQVMERDIGDMYALAAQISGTARKEGNVWLYDPKGETVAFLQKAPAVNRCVRLENVEKPAGEWNTLELVCFGGESVHVVNGKVVNRLKDAKRLDGPEPASIKEGHFCLQTEGAEMFYRGLEIRPIKEIPAEFLPH